MTLRPKVNHAQTYPHVIVSDFKHVGHGCSRFNTYFKNLACVCNVEGSLTEKCDKDGKCSCKANIIGEKCDTCKDEFHSFPLCEGKFLLKKIEAT